MTLRPASLAAAALSVATLCFAPAGRGDAPTDIATVFFVAKSENRNQVHYGVRVDATCAPWSGAPVFPYWRLLERGPDATEGLLSREVPAYGIASQRVLERGPEGGRVALELRALPGRSIEVVTRPTASGCSAFATTTISGGPARLTRVYARLRWPFGVAYLELEGAGLGGGEPVRERLTR